MTRTPLAWGALAVFVLSLVLALPAAARTNASARLQIVWPAQGTITSRFGDWRGSRRHDGVDIGMLRTLTVRAAAPGRVRLAGYGSGLAGYGKTVVVSFGSRYRLLYAHLAEAFVRPGQLVRRGQRIGRAGCSGSCSGTHLHFEVRVRGMPVNPARFLG